MEPKGEKLGKFHKGGDIWAIWGCRRVCIADRGVSDSKGYLWKEDTVGIAGHMTGRVGK